MLDAKTTKALFKRASSQQITLSYAFGNAANIADCAFVVHKTKKAKALATEISADKSVKYKKVGYGTLTVSSLDVLLTEEKKVANISRILRKLLKDNGLRYVPATEGDETVEDDAPEQIRPLTDREKTGIVATVKKLQDEVLQLSRSIA